MNAVMERERIYTTDERQSNKGNINIKKLAELFELAKGEQRNIKQFLIECKFYENEEERQTLVDIFKEKYNPSLRAYHLRQIAFKSGKRVTLEELLSVSKITINYDTTEVRNIKVERGDILWCDFGVTLGSVQGGRRPCVVLQNKAGNEYAPTTLVAPLSTAIYKRKLPVHVDIGFESGLGKDSVVELEQITTVSKKQFMFDDQKQFVGSVPEYKMIQIDSAIKKSLGLISLYINEEIILDYLQALEGIKEAKKIRNTTGLQKAESLIRENFEEYCNNYNQDSNWLINKYNNENRLQYA
jgi:mRNA interferase MazF